MEKINFSGGEPFLHDRGEFLGQMVQYCKLDLQLPSVSIVSNGSMIREQWFQKYGETSNHYLLIMKHSVMDSDLCLFHSR